MKVRCVNNIGDWEDTVRLTVGKIYNVEEIRTDGYLIKNDDEILACYYKYRFKEVKEVEKEKVLEVEFQDVFDKVAWRIVYKNEDIINMWKSKGKDNEEDFKWIFTLELFSNFGIHVSTKEEAESIKQKVDAINEKYGIPERWRARQNGRYFYITGSGHIGYSVDYYIGVDDDRYKFRNYFKSKEEAQAKLDRIKQIFAE